MLDHSLDPLLYNNKNVYFRIEKCIYGYLKPGDSVNSGSSNNYANDDADHLIQTLQSNGYELTIKDKGDTYRGMDIKFTPSQHCFYLHA
jgi:hypothetical protein